MSSSPNTLVSPLFFLCFYLQKSIVEAARDFVSFVNKGPSPYHGNCEQNCPWSFFSYTRALHYATHAWSFTQASTLVHVTLAEFT